MQCVCERRECVCVRRQRESVCVRERKAIAGDIELVLERERER